MKENLNKYSVTTKSRSRTNEIDNQCQLSTSSGWITVKVKSIAKIHCQFLSSRQDTASFDLANQATCANQLAMS